ncbi:hypothetical protein BJ508DRAFT_46166 [Ascobolus immersus RN42]|uniref:Uncharacterized protein n=1 Tax=Ascobolus immersus RN42 TaxID=1160509 RepID=A0A3N4ICW5_ASCIM|nr:hypothetical protein BJ508DRAFT_46166 [Ascobolus immersus RN42]
MTQNSEAPTTTKLSTDRPSSPSPSSSSSPPRSLPPDSPPQPPPVSPVSSAHSFRLSFPSDTLSIRLFTTFEPSAALSENPFFIFSPESSTPPTTTQPMAKVQELAKWYHQEAAIWSNLEDEIKGLINTWHEPQRTVRQRGPSASFAAPPPIYPTYPKKRSKSKLSPTSLTNKAFVNLNASASNLLSTTTALSPSATRLSNIAPSIRSKKSTLSLGKPLSNSTNPEQHQLSEIDPNATATSRPTVSSISDLALVVRRSPSISPHDQPLVSSTRSKNSIRVVGHPEATFSPVAEIPPLSLPDGKTKPKRSSDDIRFDQKVKQVAKKFWGKFCFGDGNK